MSAKQGRIWYHFYDVLCMTWSGIETTTSRSRGECSTTEPHIDAPTTVISISHGTVFKLTIKHTEILIVFNVECLWKQTDKTVYKQWEVLWSYWSCDWKRLNGALFVALKQENPNGSRSLTWGKYQELRWSHLQGTTNVFPPHNGRGPLDDAIYIYIYRASLSSV